MKISEHTLKLQHINNSQINIGKNKSQSIIWQKEDALKIYVIRTCVRGMTRYTLLHIQILVSIYN
jgi:hypothetical protein